MYNSDAFDTLLIYFFKFSFVRPIIKANYKAL